MEILYVVVDELPKNCVECVNFGCRLAEKTKTTDVLKAYYNKRHKHCPLRQESSIIKATNRAIQNNRKCGV